MTGSRRLGRIAALAFTSLSALAVSSELTYAQEAGRAFDEGVEMLNRGREADALEAFRRVLAADPSSEEAYQLWRNTEASIWQDLIRRRGQFELVTERIMSLATTRRAALERDTDVIREKLTGLAEVDPIERRRRVSSLRGEHGEFAVSLMLGALAEEGDDDRRATFMITLADMGPRVALPLIAALDAPNPSLRRNIALTLGRLGDRRARGPLAALLETDPDQGVRTAAQSALQDLGGTAGRTALELLEQDGRAYLNRNLGIAGPALASDVVWDWSGGRLISTDVPASVYPDEMARQTLFRALSVNPGSLGTLGNLARAGARMGVELDRLELVGKDTSALDAVAQRALLTSSMLNDAALDAGLASALEDSDIAGAVGLVRMIGDRPGTGGESLRGALIARFPQVREEAAIAAAHVAARNNVSASEAVVSLLGGSASRDIQRSALLIDPDGARSGQLAQALRSRGMVVQTASRGAQGLSALRRSPGVDLVIVADLLPDLTVDQVLMDTQSIPQLEGTPVLVVSNDSARAAELYGERAAGFLTTAEDLPVVEELLAGTMNRDREEAKRLAARSAAALAALAGTGTSISGAADEVAAALSNLGDSVLLPALDALGKGGEARHSAAVMEILGSSDASNESRTGAADALAGIFGRSGAAADETVLSMLEGMAADTGLDRGVRSAVGRAFGSLGVDPQARGSVLRSLENALTGNSEGK